MSRGDAHLQGDGTFDVREVDTDNYYLWTEGYFYFDNETVVEIMRELGRWYNIRVEFENPASDELPLAFPCRTRSENRRSTTIIEHAW